MQAQIDGQRALGNWDDVLKSVQTYKRLVEGQQFSKAHATQAAANAYIATVKAEVALKKKRGGTEDARRYLTAALEADAAYPVCGLLLPLLAFSMPVVAGSLNFAARCRMHLPYWGKWMLMPVAARRVAARPAASHLRCFPLCKTCH